METPPPPKTLEELIHHELSKLVERQAPDQLITRVIAQIKAREQKSWWQRPWSHWPLGMQLASVPVLLASLSGAIFVLSLVWNLLVPRSGLGAVSSALESACAVWDVLSVLGNAVAVLGRATGAEWVALAFFIPLCMYLACVGLGTLCYRVALQKR